MDITITLQVSTIAIVHKVRCMFKKVLFVIMLLFVTNLFAGGFVYVVNQQPTCIDKQEKLANGNYSYCFCESDSKQVCEDGISQQRLDELLKIQHDRGVSAMWTTLIVIGVLIVIVLLFFAWSD